MERSDGGLHAKHDGVTNTSSDIDGPISGTYKGLPRELAAALKAAEVKIRALDKENLVAVGPDGKVALDLKGGKSRVGLTGAHIAAANKVKGLVVTHNHPGSDTVPGGSSFSPDDVKLAATLGASEMRVVGQRGGGISVTYRIAPPEGKSWPNVDATLKQQQGVVQERLKAEVASGKITKGTAKYLYWHQVWVAVAEKHGLVYTKTRTTNA